LGGRREGILLYRHHTENCLVQVPPAYQKLAASRGTGLPGAVPADTVIMFAIGGYAYSIKPNPWHWLTSKEAAEKMAEKVSGGGE
jgi:hypothetical protein